MNKYVYDYQLNNDGQCKITSQDKWKNELDDADITWIFFIKQSLNQR